MNLARFFSIQLIYVIVLGFRLHFLPDIVSMLFLIRSFSLRPGLIINLDQCPS